MKTFKQYTKTFAESLPPTDASPAPEQSFGHAFKAARKQAGGPSGIFTWKGKKYNTRQADDPKPSKSKSASPKKTSYRPTGASSDVLKQQRALIAKGAKIKADGLMGPNTKAAMKKYSSGTDLQTKPQAHDVSTKSGRQDWYKLRVDKARKAGHPNPSMYASQAALETGWGKSKSAKGNLVGMKARKGQDSETKRTHEYVDGKKVLTSADFAKFDSEAGSIAQHGREWKGGTTKSDGRRYATDPDYEKKIAAITKGYA